MGKARLVMLLACVLFSVSVVAASGNKYSTGSHEYTIRYGGEDRTFILNIPEKQNTHHALVLVMHGYGSSAQKAQRKYNMDPVAEREGFVLCYPHGEKDGRGKNCWNVGYPFQKDLKRDDVGFICFLARHLQRACGINPKNIFVAGMSNGGEMCYLLAYACPEVFAAIAPVSGLTMEWIYRKYTARIPVPMMEIHGTEDRTSEWNGDLTNSGGWGEYISVPSAVGYWVAVNKCTHEIREEAEPVTEGRKTHVIKHHYTGGTDGKDVWLIEIVGGTHSWGNRDIDTNEELWKFFSRYLHQ